MSIPIPQSSSSASSSKSTSGSPSQDVLKRLLSNLSAKKFSELKGGALTLREHVEEEVRDLSGEDFNRFMDNLYERLQAMIESSSPLENFGAVLAIDELVDVSLGENAAKISRFASFLRLIFEEKTDPETIISASKTLGHLARSGGPLTAEVVEFQVRQAMDWLQGERMEARRFAAVLILKEMAINAPTVFNIHVPLFIDTIWTALRDSKPVIRERAVEALRACLCVIEKRETRWRVQGYYRLFEETQKGLSKNVSVESIHGSLLAIGELLRNTGEFMMARYKEVADIVLKYRDHRDRLVRRSITALLPRIAHFLRDRFLAHYFKISMDYLIGVMKNQSDKDCGFTALGEMAGAVGVALIPYLPTITVLLKESILPKRGKCCNEALACVGELTSALGSLITEHVRGLLNVCFSAGLSTTLVETLVKVSSRLPSLLPVIQEKLMDAISLVLARKTFRVWREKYALKQESMGKGVTFTVSHNVSSDNLSHNLIQLALKTLSSFNFQGYQLIEFARDNVIQFLDDDDALTRKEAAICCCKLLENSISPFPTSPPPSNTSSSPSTAISPFPFLSPPPTPSAPPSMILPLASFHAPCSARTKKQQLYIEEMMHSLIISSVTDPDSTIRKVIFQSLSNFSTLDNFLCQADALRAIFIALNDESFSVREHSIILTGRLSLHNPAYVYPSLRRHLSQLLIDLEHSSDSKQREESARLIGSLIRHCPKLILPYISPILKALMERLTEAAPQTLSTGLFVGGSGSSGVVLSVLVTVGKLARVGGTALKPYLPRLMPMVIDSLSDVSLSERREVVVATLGELVQSTGYVITPYTEYPQLLGILLRLLNGELAWSICRVVIQVLGILGALDPHVHKRNLNIMQQGPADVALRPESSATNLTAGVVGGGQAAGHLANVHARSSDAYSLELLPPSGLSTSSEDYYNTVAIATLMRVLRDGTLSTYHYRVVRSLMYIFKAIGLACVPYLPRVMPDLFSVMHSSDENLREHLFWQLAQLVSIVRQHIRKYLSDIMSLVYEYWSTLLLSSSIPPPSSPILHLVEELSKALHSEYKPYLLEILPRCVSVLAEAERKGEYSKVSSILHAFEVLGDNMEEQMHLLLPALLRLFKNDVSEAPIEVRASAMRTLSRLVSSMQFSAHASAIVHPLMQVLGTAIDELKREAMNVICALALSLGNDFSIFIPPIKKILQKIKYHHAKFELIVRKIQSGELSMFIESVFSSGHGSSSNNDSALFADDMINNNQSNVNVNAHSNHRSESSHGKDHNAGMGNTKPSDLLSLNPSNNNLMMMNAHDPWTDGNISTNHASTSHFDIDGDKSIDAEMDGLGNRVLKINESHLKKAWESSQRSTKEDWTEWMRHFSVELLKESPSPALRTCAGLAKRQPRVARELFAAVFVSCWNELNESSQEQLVRSLEAAFASPNIPPEILATLLNLAEFMDHDEKPLPVDIRTLAALAEKCHAFAKALHYKEMEFESNPTATVEDLIHVNNQLHQHEAAVGILVYAQRHLAVELKESWYEKLQRWEEALTAYERKCMQGENAMMVFDAMLGKMRCLSALARWQELSTLCRNAWTTAESSAKMEMAPLGATAAWNMGKWDDMAEYVAVLDDGDEAHAGSRMPSHTLTTHGGMGSGTGPSDGAFFRAVLCVRRGRFAEAQSYVERARKLLGTELAALVLESYERAYNDVVRVQQLSELEEVIEYCMLPPGEPVSKARAEIIQCMWQDRIFGVQRNVEVWQALLAVRSLVLPPDRDLRTWMKFASLCRKNGRVGQANSTLLTLLQGESATSATSMQLQQQSGGQIGLLSPAASKPGALGWGVPGAANAHPQVKLAYLKHVWALGGEGSKRHAFLLLQELSTEISRSPFTMDATVDRGSERGSIPLLAKVYQKLGSWQWALHPFLSDSTIEEVEVSLKSATEIAPEWGKAWHVWALFNTASMSYHIMKSQPAESQRHIVAAVTAYFRSISLASKSTKPRGYDSLQDILRLLTLWFSHGATADVQTALQEGFAHVSIDTWLLVIPQIIARIHSNSSAVRGLIQNLLIRIGRHHPQALMFPLLVACKSLSAARRTAAQAVLDNIRAFNPGLVDAAKLVSLELIRVAILWHEMWHEGLEEASRLYFGERNVEAMLAVLSPLHAMLDQHGPETLNEVSFVQSYGGELREANECCESFKKTGKESELTRAWDLYYHVFKRINKQLPSLTSLELQLVSPALLDAKNLDLAVPGTYRAGSPSITIAGFSPQIHVITSKQRPRKISVRGSDGMDYYFLLKGHEDLRLDERVMQLFGLVNSLLANARSAAEKDLSIERYAVIPLSPNSGLIEWLVPCDTLHQLIREYRDARKMPVNIEHRLMLAFAPDYDNLTLIAKVEVFRHALENTPGNDLARILWLKSRSSEVWLNRRTNYTRSLAVMSMVGYILGLGDRHPSNLMLDRISGKIVHIDFGDCFEASMNREKFPEKVPFRLTRMLVKAMEVSGMEGNFLFTCESVMHVLRSNKDSVMAMMEAFVHDPLINWRLFNITGTGAGRTGGEKGEKGEREDSGNNGMSSFRPSPPLRSTRERELLQAVGMLGDANDVLNDRAVAVMTRMSNKLTGRDFHPLAAGVGGGVVAGAGAGERGAGGSGSMMVRNSSDPGYGSVMGQSYEVRDEPGLSVSTQVQKLVAQATSHENLCQSYIGWCPFW